MSRRRREPVTTPADEAKIRAAFGASVEVDRYPDPAPVGQLDHSRSCGYPIARPMSLIGKLVPGAGRSGLLSCNRPDNHDGDHIYYNADFVPLARVPRWQDRRAK